MSEIVISAETVEVIIAALVPLIGWVITYIKRNLGYEQGDMAFAQLESWAKQVESLAVVFPKIKQISIELTETVAHAKKLWDAPEDNSAELAQVSAHGYYLFMEAMRLVKEYAPKEPVVASVEAPKQ